MNMHNRVTEADATRLFAGLTTHIPKASHAALELESHIFGIVTRHASMRKTKSNAQGIITAEDAQGRVFKVEISQVAGPE